MIKHQKANSYQYIHGKGLCKCKSRQYVHGKGIFDITKELIPIAANVGVIGKNTYNVARDIKEMSEGKPEIDVAKKRRIINLIDEISGTGFNLI